MPGKRKSLDSQSCDLEDPLPAPSTSRTLRPRSATVSRTRIARMADRSVSRGVSHSAVSSKHSSRHSSAGVSGQSTSTEPDQPIAGSSTSGGLDPYLFSLLGGRERRKTGASRLSPEFTSDSEAEIDQLISDREISAPSISVPESLPTSDDLAILPSTAVPASTSGGVPASSPIIAETPLLQDTGSSLTHIKSRGPTPSTSQLRSAPPPPPPPTGPQPEPLSAYTCPICFFPPTNATLTPCGHICCGACLFTAVKTTMQRGAQMMTEANVARCPICRADIPGWDGRGGGVIGLKARAMFSL